MAFGAFASFQSAFLNFTLKKDKSITEAPPAEIVNLKIPIKPPNPPKTNNNEPMKETNKQKPDATPKDKNSKARTPAEILDPLYKLATCDLPKKKDFEAIWENSENLKT